MTSLEDRVATLDLRKVMAQVSLEQGFTPEQAATAEAGYRQFLNHIASKPDKEITPTKLVDLVWHGHILETRQYMADCNTIFGGYLHHGNIEDQPERLARAREAGREALLTSRTDKPKTPEMMANCLGGDCEEAPTKLMEPWNAKPKVFAESANAAMAHCSVDHPCEEEPEKTLLAGRTSPNPCGDESERTLMASCHGKPKASELVANCTGACEEEQTTLMATFGTKPQGDEKPRTQQEDGATQLKTVMASCSTKGKEEPTVQMAGCTASSGKRRSKNLAGELAATCTDVKPKGAGSVLMAGCYHSPSKTEGNTQPKDMSVLMAGCGPHVPNGDEKVSVSLASCGASPQTEDQKLPKGLPIAVIKAEASARL